jgi:hypothetical protein
MQSSNHRAHKQHSVWVADSSPPLGIVIYAKSKAAPLWGCGFFCGARGPPFTISESKWPPLSEENEGQSLLER